MSYPPNGGGFLGIISVLAPTEKAPLFIKIISYVGYFTTTVIIIDFILSQNGIQIPISDRIFGLNIFIFFACIVILGLYKLAILQKISVSRTVVRLLLYMFIPAIILTALLFGLGYIFRWPGVVNG